MGVAPRWLGMGCACAVLVAVGLLTVDRARPAAEPAPRHAAGAYRPAGERRLHGPAQSRLAHPRAGAAANTDGALPPELEERLRAAAHLETVPAPRPAGAPAVPPPPTGPLPPEVEAQRHVALAAWRVQAQQLLDECVARPAAERRPVPLDVHFAPGPGPAPDGPDVPLLAPAAVSVPPHELRRLWQDTDPDELQACLERVRTLALAVPAGPVAPAQAPPPAMETVLVQL